MLNADTEADVYFSVFANSFTAETVLLVNIVPKAQIMQYLIYLNYI